MNNALPNGHHTGMIVVRPAEGSIQGSDWTCIVNAADVTDMGVSVWCGLFRDNTAERIEVGTVINGFIIYDRPEEDKRCKITITKVNRVTIQFRAEDTGETHSLRVDR
jgi:hypothetical protein